MSRKVAFVTGVTGQDGSYLAEFLLGKGYEVHGLIRRSSTFNTSRIDHIYQDPHDPNPKLFLHYGDLIDGVGLTNLVREVQPTEVYNLGAQSHVQVSFTMPQYTGQVDAVGAVGLLEAIRSAEISTRFYQASTSELFGSTPPPQNEESVFKPRSPYAAAKLMAYWCTVNYREGYGMHATNGILFNHESIYRPTHFVTRKVTTAIARIKLGLQNQLEIGNLEATRDWGSARDYVAAMHSILNSETPDDYVIATGKSHSVRDLISVSLRHVDLEDSFEELVKVDTTLLRTGDVKKTIGDSRKIKNSLGWEATTSFSELIYEMIQHDLGLNTISD